MSAFAGLTARISRWIDDVAAFAARLGATLRRRREATFVEDGDGRFHLLRAGAPAGEALSVVDGRFAPPPSPRLDRALAGARVELRLRPSRALRRTLELPRKAGDFLGGVVRAQIDRLTPWSAEEAAFGWGEPQALDVDRIAVPVVAAARNAVAPLAAAFVAARADSVRVCATSEVADTPPIELFALGGRADARQARTRRRLAALLAFAIVAFAAAGGASLVVGDRLDARQADLERRLATARAELAGGRASLSDAAIAALDARKRASPPSVLVVEALSRALPDDTYLAELRIEDGAVKLAGFTRDAPALIRLIEQSRAFTRATFSAPTTKAANEDRERFHIAAHIEPAAGGAP